MPTLDMVEYERFNYEESPAKPMTLDEAAKSAAESRKNDKDHFYRVRPVDDNMSAFTVQKVSTAAVYASFVSRISSYWAQHVNRSRRK